MKKFEKAKKWVKEHQVELVAIGIFTFGYLVGSEIKERRIDCGLKMAVGEGLLTLTKPHKYGEPLDIIGFDEWIKMMQERNGK